MISTLELQPFSLFLDVEEITQHLGYVGRWDAQPLDVEERGEGEDGMEMGRRFRFEFII